MAGAAASQAFKTSIVVDGVLLAASVGYSLYKYNDGQINGDELKRTVTKRSTAAAGSIGGSATGAFLGTLIFPGVGTFVGGIIGGMAGDYFGSKAGEKLYNGPAHHPQYYVDI